VTEFAASLPKARRRKPLPPGFKVALAQVLWCHGWFVAMLAAYVLSGELGQLAAVGLWAANVGLAWAKPVPWMPHSTFNIFGCVHWLRRYWREWRDD
jgi:hypothetical protein